jgi:GntR family transcriptional regulator of vanillate catabolism
MSTISANSALDAPAVSQTDRAVLKIREMLLRGDFEPGERISELPLAARLAEADVKVSRTPLRLALEQLAHEGLLRPWPTGGFVVCEFSLADVWDTIEIRGVLEGTAARLAAERLTHDAQLTRLRELCAQLDETLPVRTDTFSRYLELNSAFHTEVWLLARSPMLLRTLEQVMRLPFASPSALVFGPAEAQHSDRVSRIAQEHHRALVEAIANREGTRAESLAREHARLARNNLSRAVEDTELMGRLPGAALISAGTKAQA